MAGDSQHLRGLGDIQTERDQTVLSDAAAWMRGGVFIAMFAYLRQLVIIDQFNVVDVATVEAEDNPPVAML